MDNLLRWKYLEENVNENFITISLKVKTPWIFRFTFHSKHWVGADISCISAFLPLSYFLNLPPNCYTRKIFPGKFLFSFGTCIIFKTYFDRLLSAIQMDDNRTYWWPKSFFTTVIPFNMLSLARPGWPCLSKDECIMLPPWTLVISGWPGPCLYSQSWPTSTPTTPGPLSTLTPSLGSSSSRWWTLKRESAEKVYERVGLLHKFYISGVHLHSASSPRLNLEYTLSCFPHKDFNSYSTFTHSLSGVKAEVFCPRCDESGDKHQHYLCKPYAGVKMICECFV